MKFIRIILLLFIFSWLLLMASFPGYYDTRRTRIAYSHYYDAPSETTAKKLDDAKRLDRRDIIIYELIGMGVLTIALFAFIRIGRRE